MFNIKNLTWQLLFVTLVVSIGCGFQHGYNTGVVNAPSEKIEDWISVVLKRNISHLNETKSSSSKSKDTKVQFTWSILVSIYSVGGIIGGLLTAVVSGFFGRKWGIIFNNLLIFASAALMAYGKICDSLLIFILGRFIVGINSGLNAGLGPMYLSEIAPINLRGAISSSYQLVLVIAISFSQVLGIERILGNTKQWPYLFYIIILIPATLQMIIMQFCVESPKYLFSKKNDDSASKVLQWLRGTPDVSSEMQTIKSEIEAELSNPKVTFKELILNPLLRIPLVISSLIMLAQQFCGVNAVIFYSTSTFKEAKLEKDHAEFGTVALGVTNIFMTVIPLFLLDIVGRKTLLLIGFCGMFVDTILLLISLLISKSTKNIIAAYFSVIFMMGFVATFAVGPGPIPWFLVNEFFMQSARPLASSISVCINWFGNFIVGLGFPILQNIIGPYVFTIFIVLQFVIILFIYKVVPETKHRTTQEIAFTFRELIFNNVIYRH